MPEWRLVYLPSYEADLARFKIDSQKLEDWFTDLQKKPDYLKNAHALRGPLKPFWSAHLNEKTLYIVIYLICNGNEAACFSRYTLNQSPFIDSGTVEHVCDKANKVVYICRLLEQHDYGKL